MSWLDDLEVCDQAYAYRAALICPSCARKVMRNLGKKKDDGDSEHYPQGPYSAGGGESDTLGFCDRGDRCLSAIKLPENLGKVGCPLGNPLTEHGTSMLQKLIRSDLVFPSKCGRVIGRLVRRVWSDYCQPDELAVVRPQHLPASISAHLYQVRGLNLKLRDGIAADLDCIYLVNRHWRHDGKDAVVDLLRFRANDLGEFPTMDVASVPEAVAEGQDDWQLIFDAVSEGAWD